MALKIEIISRALVLIGANPISSLTEGTEGVVANALYEPTYKALIASHSWRFATKKAQLSRLTEAPLNEWLYQYQLPSDYIVAFRTQYNSDYEVYGDKIYSDMSELYIEYRYRVSEVMLPAPFELALEFLLAAQFAIPITDNSQRAQVYTNLYEAQLARAKFIDSSSRPQDPIAYDPFAGLL
jgi:hypothetical protein